MIVASIVSHGHGDLLPALIRGLLCCPEVSRVVVTLNVPEEVTLLADSRVVLIRNVQPKGFGANHNAAFKAMAADSKSVFYFCPINPDVRVLKNPFPVLLAELNARGAGVVAPLTLALDGQVEDSLRRFPTLFSLLIKAGGGEGGRYAVQPGMPAFYPDWVAGMFMLFCGDSFAELGGFDEGFFLYYEDVDICARAWKQGVRIVACPQAVVVHDARRDSHRNLRFMRWHVASMVRYFWKHWGRLPQRIEA